MEIHEGPQLNITPARIQFGVIAALQIPLMYLYTWYTVKPHLCWWEGNIFFCFLYTTANTFIYLRRERPAPFRTFFPLIVTAALSIVVAFIASYLNGRHWNIHRSTLSDIFAANLFSGVAGVLVARWIDSAIRKHTVKHTWGLVVLEILSVIFISFAFYRIEWLLREFPPPFRKCGYSPFLYHLIDEYEWLYLFPVVAWLATPVVIIYHNAQATTYNITRRFMKTLPRILLFNICIVFSYVIAITLLEEPSELLYNVLVIPVIAISEASVTLIFVVVGLLHNLMAHMIVWYLPRTKKAVSWKPSTP